MTPQIIVIILAFAPLLGAGVSGLLGRRIGDTAAMAVTTGLLVLSCALSWFTFVQVIWGGWPHQFTVALAPAAPSLGVTSVILPTSTMT